jgi:uncharacterized membrane protein
MLFPKANGARGKPLEIALIVGAILFILCIQILFLINFNINWDEFLYLALIFEHSSGTLSKSLQTFHVHLFAWMTNLEWDEVQLILLGRTLMLVCEILTLSCIFLISRKFVSVKFALFGVLSYLASGFVLMQGTSFRADPVITALLMAGIFLLLERSNRFWRFMAASTTVALACLISIKSVFYAPPLIGALVWRTRNIEEMKNKINVFIGFASSVSITTLVMYLWHRNTLSPGAVNGVSGLDSIFSKVLVEVTFWPQKEYFLSWISPSWPQVFLIIAGFFLLWIRHKRRFSVQLTVSVLFTLPILSIFFYRNAYPYFFPFIVAPLMVVVSIGAQAVAENVSRAFARSLMAVIVIYMVTYTVGQAYYYSYHHQTGQRQIISTIHEMFPEPTAYIDRNSMISRYPKCGFFMSSWGIETYRKRGKPVFEQALQECEPKFLITNSYQLISAMAAKSSQEAPYALFDQDARALRSNFIHHWGDIWVAGKSFDPGLSPTTFNITIEGTYTVESPKPIIVDRQQYGDGDFIFLSKGPHVIDSLRHPVDLRFGRNLQKPDFTPTRPIYFGFLWSILNMPR